MATTLGGSSQATKGTACSECRGNHRYRCVHTWLVAAAIHPATEKEGEPLDETQAAAEAFVPGEEDVGSYEAGAADAPEEEAEEGGSRRTAACQMKKNLEEYENQLRDTFHLMAINKFPPILPSSLLRLPRLPTESRAGSEGDMVTKFNIKQRHCSSCGGPLRT